MKKATSRALPKEQRAEIKALADLPDEEIDTTDIPEILDWSGAKRGLLNRPVRQQITPRLDADVVASTDLSTPEGLLLASAAGTLLSAIAAAPYYDRDSLANELARLHNLGEMDILKSADPISWMPYLATPSSSFNTCSAEPCQKSSAPLKMPQPLAKSFTKRRTGISLPGSFTKLFSIGLKKTINALRTA